MANFGKKRRFDDGGLTATGATLKVVDTADQTTANGKADKQGVPKKVKDQSFLTKSFVPKGSAGANIVPSHAVNVPPHSSLKDAKYPKSNESAKSDRQAPDKKTFGPRISEEAKLERLRATRAANVKSEAATAPKPKAKPKKPSSVSNGGNRNNKPTKIVSQGNWTNAAPARKPKTLQEAARRNQIEEYNRDKMKSRLKPLFGGKKTSTAKTTKTKTGGPKKSVSQNWFTAQMQGRNSTK